MYVVSFNLIFYIHYY